MVWQPLGGAMCRIQENYFNGESIMNIPPCYYAALFFAALFALISLWPWLESVLDRAAKVLWCKSTNQN